MTPARLDGRGAAFAALAALLWGFVPVYIGLIGDVDTTEIVVHRALWSGAILLLLMLLLPKLTGGMTAVWDAYATFAALAGAEVTDHRAAAAGLPPVDSIDLWPYLSGKQYVASSKQPHAVSSNELL